MPVGSATELSTNMHIPVPSPHWQIQRFLTVFVFVLFCFVCVSSCSPLLLLWNNFLTHHNSRSRSRSVYINDAEEFKGIATYNAKPWMSLIVNKMMAGILPSLMLFISPVNGNAHAQVLSSNSHDRAERISRGSLYKAVNFWSN